MARGRMITNLICKDKRVNALSDDTCRLLFTWLITTADREGRTYGDAAIVRSTIFPRRDDISIEKTESYLGELSRAKLIIRYMVNDEQYIFFPGFEKNQIGLRKDREAPSEIPAPPDLVNDALLLRTYSGPTPDKLPVKLMEVNGIEVNGNESEISKLSTTFINCTNIQAYKLDKWTEACNQMFTAGVSKETLKKTIEQMKHPEKGQKELSITGPWSVVNMAIANQANGHEPKTEKQPAGHWSVINGQQMFIPEGVDEPRTD